MRPINSRLMATLLTVRLFASVCRVTLFWYNLIKKAEGYPRQLKPQKNGLRSLRIESVYCCLLLRMANEMEMD